MHCFDHVITDKSLQKFRQQLEERRQELEERKHRIRDHRGEVDMEAYGHDAGDLAQYELDKSRFRQQSDAEFAELRAIDAALLRIAEGSYGDCVSCGEPIRKKRLRALPQAPLCEGCASLEERRSNGRQRYRL